MQTVLRARDSADILSLIPLLAGFHPRDSLVILPFHGSRAAGVLRFDLPGSVDPGEIERIASTFIGTLCRVEGVDAAVIAVYTDASGASGASEAGGACAPHQTLMDALLTRAHRCGVRPLDALGVGPDGWWSYLDAGGLRSLDLIVRRASSPSGARGIPQRDQSAGARLPVVDAAARKRVARASTVIDRMLLDAAHDAEHAALETDSTARRGVDESRRAGSAHSALDAARAADPAWHFLTDTPAFLERTLSASGAPLPAGDIARLLWLLARPGLRDIAILQWCDGLGAGDAALTAQREWEQGADYPQHGAERFLGHGKRPDGERLGRALELVRVVAAHARRAERPGALAAASWLAWARGSSTHAARYAQMALRIDPGHGLARIMTDMTASGRLPAWGFAAL